MVAGRRVIAIFGFCDIRQFTDTTEVLQARGRLCVQDQDVHCI